MNVESLRGNQDTAKQSAEIRIAKVAIGILVLFLLSWTPYAIVALMACFGNRYQNKNRILMPITYYLWYSGLPGHCKKCFV
jgi:hypothetical protein